MKRNKAEELKFEVVQGEEMTKEQVEDLARLLASWIIRDLKEKRQVEAEQTTPYRGSGSQA